MSIKKNLCLCLALIVVTQLVVFAVISSKNEQAKNLTSALLYVSQLQHLAMEMDKLVLERTNLSQLPQMGEHFELLATGLSQVLYGLQVDELPLQLRQYNHEYQGYVEDLQRAVGYNNPRGLAWSSEQLARVSGSLQDTFAILHDVLQVAANNVSQASNDQWLRLSMLLLAALLSVFVLHGFTALVLYRPVAQQSV